MELKLLVQLKKCLSMIKINQFVKQKVNNELGAEKSAPNR
jgi:hypothetical protein